MEVQLKTVKITKSILSQLEMANITQMLSYTPLGYVIDNVKGCKLKKILFYDSRTLTLCFCYYPSTIEVREDFLQDGSNEKEYRIVMISDKGMINTKPENCRSKGWVDELCKKLLQQRTAAYNIGQIYY